MLDKETTEKIEKAIKESLPAQVGDVLRKELEKIPYLEKEWETSKLKISGLEEHVKSLQNEKTKLSEEISKHSLLNIRETEISKRERDFEISKLTYELQAEREKTEFTKSVALGLVRNIDYRRSILGNDSVPTKDQYGNTQFHSVMKNKTETKSAE